MEHPRNKILQFDLIDYNFNIGAKVDRKWNVDNKLKELSTLNETLITIYGPASPFGLFNLLRN